MKTSSFTSKSCEPRNVSLSPLRLPLLQPRTGRGNGGGEGGGAGGVTQQILSNAAMALDGWWPLGGQPTRSCGRRSERKREEEGRGVGGCDSMGSH
ncbi:hypothetical protein DPEC_G00135060 [Dallia pectoralis]|uniref:Uncharacterized protein n=1 Tax=Dallia pectoralis TaxID=75939 RepID=A0ACC2GS15_DALPE|nr:hypothetical protein DPEC_G00135060 [Dallia pectoralis]